MTHEPQPLPEVPLRVLVCGPRDWTDREAVYKGICDATRALFIGPPSVIIHGAASGVDTFADDWAQAWNVIRLRYHADWKTHGKAAGPIRNQRMLDEGKPNLALAFQYEGRETRGTQNMIKLARAAGIPVIITVSQSPPAPSVPR